MKTTIISSFFVLSTLAGMAQTLVLRPDSVDGKDAEVSLLYPNLNTNSTKFNSYAWTQGGQLNVLRALIDFDWSQIPAGATINSAYLSMYYQPNYPPPYNQHTGSNASVFMRVTSAWQETTVTWNNQPSYDTSKTVMVPQSSGGTHDYLNMDMTPLVKDILANPNSSYGFVFKLIDESPEKRVHLASSDEPDTSMHPKMVINYTLTPTGLQDKEKLENHIKVYPNPTTGKVYVNNSSGNSRLQLQVYNLLGETILTQELNGPLSTFDLSDQPKGMYLIDVFDGENRFSERVVLN